MDSAVNECLITVAGHPEEHTITNLVKKKKKKKHFKRSRERKYRRFLFLFYFICLHG